MLRGAKKPVLAIGRSKGSKEALTREARQVWGHLELQEQRCFESGGSRLPQNWGPGLGWKPCPTASCPQGRRCKWIALTACGLSFDVSAVSFCQVVSLFEFRGPQGLGNIALSVCDGSAHGFRLLLVLTSHVISVSLSFLIRQVCEHFPERAVRLKQGTLCKVLSI